MDITTIKHTNSLNTIPAAACPRCGGWTSMGGMSQHFNATEPVEGRTGCVCHKTGVWTNAEEAEYQSLRGSHQGDNGWARWQILSSKREAAPRPEPVSKSALAEALRQVLGAYTNLLVAMAEDGDPSPAVTEAQALLTRFEAEPKPVVKGSVVRYVTKDGVHMWMRVTAVIGTGSKARVNLGAIFGGKVYYKGVSIERVVEDEAAWHAKYVTSETYRSA